jgi:pilus assembly protein Flp/PilA
VESNAFHRKLQQLRECEKGATAVEYGLMLALIAATIIVAVSLLGDELNTVFQEIVTRLAAVAPGGATN